MKVMCPNCNTEWSVGFKELRQECISVQIKYEGDFLQAKTVGGVITNLAKMLDESARVSVGKDKVYIGFGGIEMGEHEMTIKVFVTNKSGTGEKC